MGLFSSSKKKRGVTPPPPPPPPPETVTIYVNPPASEKAGQIAPDHVKFTLNKKQKDKICEESALFFGEKLAHQLGPNQTMTIEADPKAFRIALNALQNHQIVEEEGKVPDLLTLGRVCILAVKFKSAALCNAAMDLIYAKMWKGEMGGQLSAFAKLAYKYNLQSHLAKLVRAVFIAYSTETFTPEYNKTKMPFPNSSSLALDFLDPWSHFEARDRNIPDLVVLFKVNDQISKHR